MSMPTFPENSIDVSREQALNMLLGSIAMEELALSHIMNAEGEKLQFFLGTLPDSPQICSTPQQILAVNHSISNLLERVNQSQILLSNKLSQVLTAMGATAPCPLAPVAENHPHIACVLTVPCPMCWRRGTALAWTPVCCLRNSACWCKTAPEKISPPVGGASLIQYAFALLPSALGLVSICVQAMTGNSWEALSDCTTCSCVAEQTVSLSGSFLVEKPCALAFFLKSPCSVSVTQATITVTPLHQ